MDPADRDRFVLTRPAVLFLQSLVPEEGAGEAMAALIALAHHAYCFWAAGGLVRDLSTASLARLAAGTDLPAAPGASPAAYYIQVPPHRVWAQVVPGGPHEPLDGCFLQPLPDAHLRVLAVFGLHAQRAGLTVTEVAGPAPATHHRPDGTPAFTPRVAGGVAAGLVEVEGTDELLDFGWRAHRLATADPRE